MCNKTENVFHCYYRILIAQTIHTHTHMWISRKDFADTFTEYDSDSEIWLNKKKMEQFECSTFQEFYHYIYFNSTTYPKQNINQNSPTQLWNRIHFEWIAATVIQIAAFHSIVSEIADCIYMKMEQFVCFMWMAKMALNILWEYNYIMLAESTFCKFTKIYSLRNNTKYIIAYAFLKNNKSCSCE